METVTSTSATTIDRLEQLLVSDETQMPGYEPAKSQHSKPSTWLKSR